MASTPNQLSIVVKGRVLHAHELKEYAERHGLCTICGLYQTHKKVGNFITNRLEPITVTDPRTGVITVYKGHCIQPTCYTSVEQVKEKMGEITKHRRQDRRSTNRQGSTTEDQVTRSSQGPNNHSPNRNPPSNHHPHHRPTAPQASPRVTPVTTSRGFVTVTPTSARRPFSPPGVFMPPPPAPQEVTPPSADSSGSHQKSPRTRHKHRTEQITGSRNVLAREGHTEASSSHNRQLDNSGGPRKKEISFDSQECARPSVSSHRRTTESGGGNGVRGESSPSVFNSSSSEFALPSPLPLPPLGTVAFTAEELCQFASRNTANNAGDLQDQDADKSQVEHQHPDVAELASLVSDGDYIAFLCELDSRGTEPMIVLEGFKLFRYHLVKNQMSKPDSIILAGHGWVKTIHTRIEAFPTDKDVLVSGLLTLLTLSVLHGKYKKSMVLKGTVKYITKMMDEHEGDKDVINLVCAILLSLSLDEKEGLNAKCDDSANVIRKLADLATSSDSCGGDLALRTLFHLSKQKRLSRTTGKAASHDVRNALAGETTTGAIVDIIQSKDTNESIVEAGLSVLWRMSVPKEDDDKEPIPATEKLMGAIVLAMERFSSAEVLEASCGLLANLSLRKTLPAAWVEPAVQAICQSFSNADHVDEGLAISGVHAMCNLLANSSARSVVISNPQAMPTILALLAGYPQSVSLVEYACLAIGHAARDEQAIKESVVAIGGFDLVRKAFEDHVKSRGDDPSLEVKDAALCALATLSGCREGAHQIVKTGLLDVLQALLVMETDNDFKLIIKTIIKNARAGSTFGFAESGLSQQPELFSKILQNSASEDEIASVLRELRVLEQPGMVAFGNLGFDTLLSTMTSYRSSSTIQERGCALLAEVYFYYPLTTLNAPVKLPGGSLAVFYKQEAIITLHSAMSNHRGDAGIQNHACNALQNFLARILETDESSSERQEVSRWIEPCFKDVVDSITINHSDIKVQKSAINLFWALSLVCSRDDLKRWALTFLQQMFNAMRRHPNDSELNEVACEVLVALQDFPDILEFMANSSGIAALLTLIGADKDEVARNASGILSSLLKEVYTASSQVTQVPDAILKLVGCMTSHQPDARIQINVSSIFESIINLEDYSIRSMIAEHGGLHALCDALIPHGSDSELVPQVCRVLYLIIPAVNSSLIVPMRDPLGKTFVKVLEQNVKRPAVESDVMDALWTCCCQDEYFKHILINESCLQVIIQSMEMQLGSSELQRSGCRLLWILSGYGRGKQMIGECGGVSAVVNALLAHSFSTAVQKEALTALKNLATTASNKYFITQAGGETAVQYSLWIHFRDPQVISTALSALNNIAVDSETRTVALMKSAILDIVIITIKRFPRDEHVQGNACFYLKSCSYLPANLQMMRQRGRQLVPLLMASAQNFPQQCGVRASSVATKIQQMR